LLVLTVKPAAATTLKKQAARALYVDAKTGPPLPSLSSQDNARVLAAFSAFDAVATPAELVAMNMTRDGGGGEKVRVMSDADLLRLVRELEERVKVRLRVGYAEASLRVPDTLLGDKPLYVNAVSEHAKALGNVLGGYKARLLSTPSSAESAACAALRTGPALRPAAKRARRAY